MALDITLITPPGDIAVEDVIIKKLDLDTNERATEETDSVGHFVKGFSHELATTGTLSVKGEVGATIPAVGTGANTAASPRVTGVKSSKDESGNAIDIAFKYVENGTGTYPTEA